MPKTKIIQGSGNIFADIGVRNPEESLAKANVARAINRIIAERGLTQSKAAGLLDIDQPRVCALARGRLSLFSLEKLLSFVAKLGSGVEIKIGAANQGILVVEDSAISNPYQHPEKLYGTSRTASRSGWAYGASTDVSSTTAETFFGARASGNFVVDSGNAEFPSWLAARLNDSHSNYNPNG